MLEEHKILTVHESELKLALLKHEHRTASNGLSTSEAKRRLKADHVAAIRAEGLSLRQFRRRKRILAECPSHNELVRRTILQDALVASNGNPTAEALRLAESRYHRFLEAQAATVYGTVDC